MLLFFNSQIHFKSSVLFSLLIFLKLLDGYCNVSEVFVTRIVIFFDLTYIRTITQCIVKQKIW